MCSEAVNMKLLVLASSVSIYVFYTFTRIKMVAKNECHV